MTDKKRPPKRRIDSVSAVHEAIVAGGKKIIVPRDIRFTPKQRLIFTEICAEFSKSELTGHKIRLAASLAKDMAAMEAEQNALATEGYVFVNSHGNATASPRLRALQTLTSAVLSTRRSLGIHARELAGGDNRRAGIHRAHNKANERALSDDDDFARPNVVPFGRREHEEEDDD
jgi:hypothetical protein